VLTNEFHSFFYISSFSIPCYKRRRKRGEGGRPIIKEKRNQGDNLAIWRPTYPTDRISPGGGGKGKGPVVEEKNSEMSARGDTLPVSSIVSHVTGYSGRKKREREKGVSCMGENGDRFVSMPRHIFPSCTSKTQRFPSLGGGKKKKRVPERGLPTVVPGSFPGITSQTLFGIGRPEKEKRRGRLLPAGGRPDLTAPEYP